jgi:hypothetical protein
LPADGLPKGFAGPFSVPGIASPAWRWDKCNILASVEVVDGQRWLHISASAKKLPTHWQLCRIRAAFFSPDSVVVAVFPPESEYINHHPRVLHLWERLDGPRLVPDLRKLDDTINALSI